MPTNFPAALDTFVNPGAGDTLNTAGVVHHQQHANLNDAVAALQAKVGTTGSAVPMSLSKRAADLELAVASTRRLATSPKPYTVGVYYFGGWSVPGGGYEPYAANPLAAIPDNRIPLSIGRYDETAQDTCDYQLELMRDYGIDYVVVLMFFKLDGNGNIVPYLDDFLNRYMTSTVPNKPKLALMFVSSTNAQIYTAANWSSIYPRFFPYFRDPNYLREENGKPALFVFDVPSFHSIMGGTSAVANALTAARSAAMTEFGGIHFYGACTPAGEFWRAQTISAGWDGVTAYTIFSKTELYGDAEASSKTGFARLDDAVFGLSIESTPGGPALESIGGNNYHSWFGHPGFANPPAYPAPAIPQWGWSGSGIGSIVTPIMTGWDPRPWGGDGSIIAIPSDAEFEAHLLRARAATDASRAKTKGKVIVCAWNEFGECQILQPTVAGGWGKLKAVARVFGR